MQRRRNVATRTETDEDFPVSLSFRTTLRERSGLSTSSEIAATGNDAVNPEEAKRTPTCSGGS